jgi:rubrerythrin
MDGYRKLIMETKFSVFEILEIAEHVEQRGATFYMKTAELFEDTQIRNLYFQLANWKAKQKKVWSQRRKEFSQSTGEFGTFDPDDYVLSNPEVMAGLTWFGTRTGSVKKLHGHETREEILHDVINREKAVVTFYQGLKGFARDPATEQAVDELIAQESQYIRTLTQEINKQ